MNIGKVAAAAAVAIAMAVAVSPAQARDFSGSASWYQHGSRTANGERFNPDGLSAAHRTLPFGTRLTVTNLRNGKSVNVRVNDRGPFTGGRILDVSRGAARQLGMISSGTAKVRVQVRGSAEVASN